LRIKKAAVSFSSDKHKRRKNMTTTSNAIVKKPEPRFIDTSGYGFNAATTAVIRAPANAK